MAGGWCIAAVKVEGGDGGADVEVVGRAGGGGLFISRRSISSRIPTRGHFT